MGNGYTTPGTQSTTFALKLPYPFVIIHLIRKKEGLLTQLARVKTGAWMVKKAIGNWSIESTEVYQIHCDDRWKQAFELAIPETIKERKILQKVNDNEQLKNSNLCKSIKRKTG